MEKTYYDICYDILSKYLDFPDIADTYKDINDGQYYQAIYLQNVTMFASKRDEIICYILKARKDNIIYAYQEKESPFLLTPPTEKTIFQLNANELYSDLNFEILALVLKGIHQIIKRYHKISDDNELTAELIKEDLAVLQKYDLPIPASI